jgi:pimeloyl-ACP methyl ester carboxylesterase
MRVRRPTLAGLIFTSAVLLGALASHASAASYAPLDQPGPPLTVPLVQLQGSLKCEPGVQNARVEPVLLNPATGVTATQNYSWNWEPALDKLGIPWCAYTAPHSTLDNIETSGEYLAFAIRTMHALAHRRIAIMGHSQGGMSMRWALRFWPDTRPMVDDLIGFSGSNHGTTVGGAVICGDGCPPADWQQFAGSHFIQALNSYAETFPGIAYTEIYTHTDEVVQPNNGPNASAALHTGGGQITNVATQDICPGDINEHNMIGTVDPVAYALAVDALTHPGPADPARISRSVCSQLYMPGVNPLSAATYLQVLAGAPGVLSVAFTPAAPATTGVQNLSAEPPLACYVFATCGGAQAPTLTLRFKVHRQGRRRSVKVRVSVVAREGDGFAPVPGATVSLAGHHILTSSNGAATLRVRLAPRRRYRISATLAGCNPAQSTIVVRRRR